MSKGRLYEINTKYFAKISKHGTTLMLIMCLFHRPTSAVRIGVG